MVGSDHLVSSVPPPVGSELTRPTFVVSRSHSTLFPFQNTDFSDPSEWSAHLLYPRVALHIEPNRSLCLPRRVRVFNNAGGAMGSMFIVHASITEYRKSHAYSSAGDGTWSGRGAVLLTETSTLDRARRFPPLQRVADRSSTSPRHAPVIIFGTALGTEGHTGRHTYVLFSLLRPSHLGQLLGPG